MTNKPMLSVERDTLEWVLNCWPKEQKGNVQEVIPSQVKELRALLYEQDEPFNPKGWSIEKIQYFLTFLMLVILLVGVYAVGTSGIGVSIEVCEEVKTQVVCGDRS